MDKIPFLGPKMTIFSKINHNHLMSGTNLRRYRHQKIVKIENRMITQCPFPIFTQWSNHTLHGNSNIRLNDYEETKYSMAFFFSTSISLLNRLVQCTINSQSYTFMIHSYNQIDYTIMIYAVCLQAYISNFKATEWLFHTARVCHVCATFNLITQVGLP